MTDFADVKEKYIYKLELLNKCRKVLMLNFEVSDPETSSGQAPKTISKASEVDYIKNLLNYFQANSYQTFLGHQSP
jgi:hypothetical protein